ncbi:hypothetical protein ACJX0J_039663, partial [Zea mays]
MYKCVDERIVHASAQMARLMHWTLLTLAEFLSKATGTAVIHLFGVAAQPDQGLACLLYFIIGYVVYLVRVRRGGRKRPLPKYIIYGKPKYKRSVAEERARRKLGGLRVFNSYWVNE